MLVLTGAPALSPFRLAKLLERLRAFEPRVRALETVKELVIAFSIQFATLCKDKRRGDISLRSKIAPMRENEPPCVVAYLQHRASFRFRAPADPVPPSRLPLPGVAGFPSLSHSRGPRKPRKRIGSCQKDIDVDAEMKDRHAGRYQGALVRCTKMPGRGAVPVPSERFFPYGRNTLPRGRKPRARLGGSRTHRCARGARGRRKHRRESSRE